MPETTSDGISLPSIMQSKAIFTQSTGVPLQAYTLRPGSSVTFFRYSGRVSVMACPMPLCACSGATTSRRASWRSVSISMRSPFAFTPSSLVRNISGLFAVFSLVSFIGSKDSKKSAADRAGRSNNGRLQ